VVIHYEEALYQVYAPLPLPLCKCNGVADVKIRPSPYVSHCRIWSLCVKGCGHKYGKTQHTGSPVTPLSWDGMRG